MLHVPPIQAWFLVKGAMALVQTGQSFTIRPPAFKHLASRIALLTAVGASLQTRNPLMHINSTTAAA